MLPHTSLERWTPAFAGVTGRQGPQRNVELVAMVKKNPLNLNALQLKTLKVALPK